MKNYGKASNKLLISIIVLISIVVIVIIGIFGIRYYETSYKQKQEKILGDTVISMYNSKSIDNETKTTGNFAKIEEAVKQYYENFRNTNKELSDIYSQNLLYNSLSSTNIAADGPDFNKTRENIKKIRDTQNSTNTKYSNLSSDEYITAQANELNLDKYYTDLFIFQVNNNLKVKEDADNIKQITGLYDNWLTEFENILNFLTENKANWKINGSNILFTSNNLVTKYNELLANLKSKESLLSEKMNSFKF